MKTAQLQIRVTPSEKARIERAARQAGLGTSAYVLGRLLPGRAGQWRGHVPRPCGAALHRGRGRIVSPGTRGARGEYRPWLESSHLRVMVAQPAYLLAMKCLAFRIGAEFHDEDDVRFLLRLLELRSYAKALETIGRYYPKERFPQKTLYALAELLPED